MRPQSITLTRWSDEEDDWIRANYQRMNQDEMAQALGRSLNAVRHRCHRLGCRRTEHWTESEIDLLVRWYRERDGKPLDLDALATQIGRLKSNVSRKARELGLSNQRRTTVEKIDGRYPRLQPKYASREEQYAALSVVRRQWHQQNPHPRGALGIKHSPETRALLSAASRRGWDGMTPKRLEERRRKTMQTNIERYGTGSPNFQATDNPYSRGKRGFAPDVGSVFFRSMWEANYCRYLMWLKDMGQIQGWLYEPDTFVFHGVVRAPITYTPDFKVTEIDGSVVYHEVKGWMDSKSKSKLKRMKKFYPDVAVIVIDEDAFKALARSVSSMIPHWGDPLVSKKVFDELA